MNEARWARRRAAMIKEQIRRRGIDDPRLLAALARVPRERFLPEGSREHAYSDHALPIGAGQTISQPYMVAAMTDALGVREGDRVLEVGTGSGYQTAVLAHLAREVYSVERIPALADAARVRLVELDLRNVRVREGDGSLGWPEQAPFEGILVTAGAPDVPPTLLDQLHPDGGRLVAPVGDRSLQRLLRVTREGNQFVRETLMGCRFVPLVGAEGWTEADF